MSLAVLYCTYSVYKLDLLAIVQTTHFLVTLEVNKIQSQGSALTTTYWATLFQEQFGLYQSGLLYKYLGHHQTQVPEKTNPKNTAKISYKSDSSECITTTKQSNTLQWRHNERNGITHHRRLHCLRNCWFRRRSKKTSKLPVTSMRGIHRWPVNSPHKRPVTRKIFPFDDVIMTRCTFRLI